MEEFLVFLGWDSCLFAATLRRRGVHTLFQRSTAIPNIFQVSLLFTLVFCPLSFGFRNRSFFNPLTLLQRSGWASPMRSDGLLRSFLSLFLVFGFLSAYLSIFSRSVRSRTPPPLFHRCSAFPVSSVFPQRRLAQIVSMFCLVLFAFFLWEHLRSPPQWQPPHRRSPLNVSFLPFKRTPLS